MKQVKVSELKPWDENPKDCSDEEFTRLLKQLRFGEVENLVVMKDGTVLSGNRRIEAYNRVGKETAWVSEIDFVPLENGKFHMTVDGEVAVHRYPEEMKGTPVEFNSQREAMIAISTLGNDHVGRYNDFDLAELLTEVELEPNLFEVQLSSPVKAEDLMTRILPPDEDEDEVLEEKPSIKAIKFYLSADDFMSAKKIIRRVMKDGGYKNQNEVFMEAMIAVDDRVEAINYNG